MKYFPVHLTRREYREEYLRSDEWQQKRKVVIDRDPICRICEKQHTKDVHHLTYVRFQCENVDTDLVGVCRQCHNYIHKHRFLSEISNIEKLKIQFKQAKQKIALNKEFIEIILLNPLNNRLRIAGILKIPVEYIEKFLSNKKITYGQFLKIKSIISRVYKTDSRKKKIKRNVVLRIL